MLEHVPAISGIYATEPRNISTEMKYWRKECPVFTPFLLLSYGIKLTWGVPDIECFHTKEYNFLFLDSGGFQIAERGINIDAEEVIRWQLRQAELSGTKKIVAFPLDYPISGRGSVEVDVSEVEKRASLTNANLNKLLRYRDRFEVYAIFQSTDSLKMNEIWWKRAVEPFIKDVDGIALSARPLKKMHVISPLSLSYVSENFGNGNVHVFMGSGKKIITSLEYFSEKFKRFTFDSSTFTMMTARGSFNLLGLDKAISGNTGLKSDLEYIGLRCRCPACLELAEGDIGSLLNTNKSFKYTILSLHNLFHIHQYMDYLHIVHRLRYEKFLNMLQKIGIDVEFLKTFEEEGFQKAYEKRFQGRLNRWF
ncbi:MAG: hypothetical protein QXP04_02385 [Candidatus Nanoarchaeia archaeon]|nr:hypothetical protein [Candidatus Jingweiarchaeum tengchongense]